MTTLLKERPVVSTLVEPYYAEEINREYLEEAIYIAAYMDAMSEPVKYIDSSFTIPLDDVNKVVLDDEGKRTYLRIHRTVLAKKRQNS